MKQQIFGKSVQGASHKKNGSLCQDTFIINKHENGVILAVADGHGSKSCPFSNVGSSIAVNVFVNIMTEYLDSYKNNLESLLTFLNREGELKICQEVDKRWKRYVLKNHIEHNRVIDCDDETNTQDIIYKSYGTTLLGMLITPIFVFAFQIGDGDIVRIKNGSFEKIIETNKILGVETHSLSSINSWKNAVTMISRIEYDNQLPVLYMMSTDGFSNSFKDENEFKKTCLEYFNIINNYGPNTVKVNLKDWLNETSQEGCGDDITLLICYFYDNTHFKVK